MSKILSLGYEYDHDYALIAINSTLEDYRLAYLLNSELKLKLERQSYDLDFTNKDCSFPIYGFDCDITFSSWYFLNNKNVVVSQTSNQNNLFQEESKTSFLIQEKKNIDYFLKIEGDFSDAQILALLDTIKTIKGVIASYAIDPQTLKSKDYLIF